MAISIPATGKVTVATVTSDIPVLTNAPAVVLTVDEDDIETPGSTGSAPDDGNLVDGSFTGPAGRHMQGPANATSGSLAGIVVALGGRRSAELRLRVGSHGACLADGSGPDLGRRRAELRIVVGNTLYGFANAAGPGGLTYDAGEDRLVFTLEVNPATGAFTFALHDQLDHAPGAGQNALSINFGAALQATDFDGDFIPLTGKVTVTVTDDIPQIVLMATGQSVIHDDTAGNDADANDTNIGLVSDQFDGFQTFKLISAIGYARNTAPVFAYGAPPGADDPLDLELALGIVGDIDSGLKTTEGLQISLYVQDGLIVGRIDNADGTPSARGHVAFAIAIDPLGGVNIAQYLSLEHPLPGCSHGDELVSLAGKVQIT